MTKKRLEKALIAALTFGAGSAVGGCILPRSVLPGASEETKVHIWRDTAIHFSVAFLLSFVASLVMPDDWKKAK